MRVASDREDPGIGPLVATAIVAAIGNGAAFRKGREFAAWLGIVPRQYSTGGKAKLYGISKRGNDYLRKILIHGARAVVLGSKRDRIAIGGWLTALEARAPRNVLIVATANKLARIAWAVLSSGQDYRSGSKPSPSLGKRTRPTTTSPTEVCTGQVKMKEQSKRRT